MAVTNFNLANRQRAERKLLITVAEWKEGTQTVREFIGLRTPDSSVEYNADIETVTDIRGITWTEVNKTEPQQSVDPYTVMGGSTLGPKLDDIRRRNAVSEYSQFTVYIITAYKGTAGSYQAEKHDGCTIVPTALGGESYVNMPIEIHLSNDSLDSNGKSIGHAALGTVSSLTDEFVFTEASAG